MAACALLGKKYLQCLGHSEGRAGGLPRSAAAPAKRPVTGTLVKICAIETEVGRQLKPVVEELRMAARQQPANVDETAMGRAVGCGLW